jgi:hypothetical protein
MSDIKLDELGEATLGASGSHIENSFFSTKYAMERIEISEHLADALLKPDLSVAENP